MEELTELEQITKDLLAQVDVVETIIHDENCKFPKISTIELSSIILGKKLIKTMIYTHTHIEGCTRHSCKEHGFNYEIINL